MSKNSNSGGIQISGKNITTGAVAAGDHAVATSYGQPQPERQPGLPEEPEKVRVLFALANPRGTEYLRLNEEMRAIQEALRLGRQRQRIQERILPAATANDLRRALLDEPYQIVHLASHGSSSGLVLEDQQGQPYAVSQEALALHFRDYRQTLRCVLLNACYSLATGQRIALGVPYVVAMQGPVYDLAAIEFSRGFYDAISAGEDIERAYREGQSAVRYAGLERDFLAVLVRE